MRILLKSLKVLLSLDLIKLSKIKEKGENMKELILESKELCKSFANQGVQNHILDCINLKIYKEDFTIIMGSSGAGKSTLLYCLSGMDTITSGSVLFKQEPIEKKKEKEMAKLRQNEFGFVFQQAHLIQTLSVYENVLVSGYLQKNKSTVQVKKSAQQLLELVHLMEAKDRLPSQISGGEAQRGAIARALINEPRLLFADEPTGALNRKNSDYVMELLTKIHRNGQSIVLVTHDIQTAIYGNRILYLSDGQVKGDMELAAYQKEQKKERERQIQAYLASMEW